MWRAGICHAGVLAAYDKIQRVWARYGGTESLQPQPCLLICGVPKTAPGALGIKIRAWQEAQQSREETRGLEFCDGLCSHLPLGEHNDHTRKVQVQGVGCMSGGSRHWVSSGREGVCQQRQRPHLDRMLSSGDRLICISTQESRRGKLGLGICRSAQFLPPKPENLS